MLRSLEKAISRVITSIGKVFRGRGYYARYKKLYSKDLEDIPSIKIISHNARGAILDVGCGVGWFSKSFEDYFGLDNNREAIEMAKKNVDSPFIIADALHLPFQSEAFDTCILYDVVEHIKDLKRLISEVKRVANNVLISCADFESYYRFFTFDETHRTLFSPEELLKQMRDHFSVLRLFRTSGIFMLPSPVNHFLARYFPNQIVLIVYSQ